MSLYFEEDPARNRGLSRLDRCVHTAGAISRDWPAHGSIDFHRDYRRRSMITQETVNADVEYIVAQKLQIFLQLLVTLGSRGDS